MVKWSFIEKDVTNNSLNINSLVARKGRLSEMVII